VPVSGRTPAEKIAGGMAASNSRRSRSSTHGFTNRLLLLTDIGVFRHARAKKRRKDFNFIEAISQSYGPATRSNRSVTKAISPSKPIMADDRLLFYQPDIKIMSPFQEGPYPPIAGENAENDFQRIAAAARKRSRPTLEVLPDQEQSMKYTGRAGKP
jgi:hypothetical protein